VDDVDEVPEEPYLDIMGLAYITDIERDSTSFGLSTFGLLPKDIQIVNYYFIVDLDSNRGTGGMPGEDDALNIPTRFEGAEFVARVAVSGTGGIYNATTTVWRFQEGEFVRVVSPNISGQVETLLIAMHPLPGSGREFEVVPNSNVIELTVSSDVRGPISKEFRLEVISENPLTGRGDNRDSVGRELSLTVPVFAKCQVTPAIGEPGQTFELLASSLPPRSDVRVFLGDMEVARGITDDRGKAFIELDIPRDSALGVRLITAGVGAVTADCAMSLVTPRVRGFLGLGIELFEFLLMIAVGTLTVVSTAGWRLYYKERYGKSRQITP